MHTLIIANGLINTGKTYQLHPELQFIEPMLQRYWRQWFQIKTVQNPVSLLIKYQGIAASQLLAQQCPKLENKMQQCWIASPWHGGLGRDHVRVLPEAMFPWTQQDSLALCEQLNPLLHDEGLHLQAIGTAMLLCCQQIWDVDAIDFSSLAGYQLPNRLPAGKDAGRMTRLLSEIQMSLHLQPLAERAQRGDPAVHGLWFWNPSPWPQKNIPKAAIVSKHREVSMLVEARNAKVFIDDAESLQQVYAKQKPPKTVFLAANDVLLRLNRKPLPRLAYKAWKPKNTQTEDKLWQALANV